jgi:transcription antitermination factor NusG
MFDAHRTKWFALHVRSRHEKSVHAQLQAKQQDVFLPLYAAKRKWADRSRVVALPLFPGYVFCRFNLASRYSVLATSGVIDLVRAGAEPSAIENSEIQALQLIVSSRVAAEPHARLVKGQRVVMTRGPLNGLTGTLTSIRNSVRLVVSVELLCRSVLVEIDRDWIAEQDVPSQIYSRNSCGS